MVRTDSIVIGLFVFLSGCKPAFNPQDYFAFPIEEVHGIPVVELDSSQEASISGIGDLWRFEVIDTLVVYYKKGIGQTMYHVAGLKSGEDLGHFCIRGRGPGEVLATNPSFQIVDGNVVVFDLLKGQYFELNIDKSLKAGNTKYDRQVQLQDYAGRTFQHPRKVSENRVLLFDSATVPESNSLSHLPAFALYDLSSGNLLRDYSCFQQIPYIHKREKDYLPQELLTMDLCVDSSGQTICFVMNMFPLIGFLDIETGKARGIWLNDKPLFSERGSRHFHFLSCESNGENIFALYQGVISGKNEEETPSELYVFDWYGNVKKRIQLDKHYYWISLYKDKLYLQYYSYINNEWEARFCSQNIDEINNL